MRGQDFGFCLIVKQRETAAKRGLPPTEVMGFLGDWPIAYHFDGESLRIVWVNRR